MGLFGKSSPVLCAVCGNEAVHKHKAADGIICDDCFLAAGFEPGMVCFGTEIEHIILPSFQSTIQFIYAIHYSFLIALFGS